MQRCRSRSNFTPETFPARHRIVTEFRQRRKSFPLLFFPLKSYYSFTGTEKGKGNLYSYLNGI